jgi:hypothetical protein
VGAIIVGDDSLLALSGHDCLQKRRFYRQQDELARTLEVCLMARFDARLSGVEAVGHTANRCGGLTWYFFFHAMLWAQPSFRRAIARGRDYYAITALQAALDFNPA